MMNDPHVVALNYVIRHSDSFDYSKAEPLYRDEVGEKRGCVGSERLGWLHGTAGCMVPLYGRLPGRPTAAPLTAGLALSVAGSGRAALPEVPIDQNRPGISQECPVLVHQFWYRRLTGSHPSQRRGRRPAASSI